MTAINRTMIVTDADRELASAITDLFAGSPQHIFSFPLSATGSTPPTHWLGSGPVPDGYERLAPWQTWVQETDEQGQQHWVCTERYPGNPKAVYAACQQPVSEDDPSPRVPCTLEQIEALFAASDMTEQDPWTAMARAGLKPAFEVGPVDDSGPSGSGPSDSAPSDSGPSGPAPIDAPTDSTP